MQTTNGTGWRGGAIEFGGRRVCGLTKLQAKARFYEAHMKRQRTDQS